MGFKGVRIGPFGLSSSISVGSSISSGIGSSIGIISSKVSSMLISGIACVSSRISSFFSSTVGFGNGGSKAISFVNVNISKLSSGSFSSWGSKIISSKVSLFSLSFIGKDATIMLFTRFK